MEFYNKILCQKNYLCYNKCNKYKGEVMKNTKKVIALALLASLSVNSIGLVSPQSENIAYASQNLDFGISTKNFESKTVTLNLKQDEANKQASLAAIKEIRAKMWDENVPYISDADSNPNNMKLRDYLKSKGITSKDAYINRMNWSTDLERIVIQRMYEVSLTGLSHMRPDGSDCATAQLPSGTRTYAEILANNSDPYTPAKAFNQWAYSKRANFGGKSEYDLLLESNGVYNNGNAHLHIILDPEYDHMGLSIIYAGDLNYVGVEFGYADKSGSNPTGLVGDYTMYFGQAKAQESPKTDKKLSKEQRERLEKSVSENKTQIAAVNLLFETSPNKVAKVKDRLLALIEKSEKLIQRAEALLNQ